MSDKHKGEICEGCGKFVEGFILAYCCTQPDCGCHGRPLEPCICSEECWDKLMEPREPSNFAKSDYLNDNLPF